MLPTDEWDGTIGAAAVAAFGYFEIGIVGRCASLALAGEGCLAFDEHVPGMNAIPCVHFWQFGGQLVVVALYKTTHRYQLSTTTVACVTLVEILFCLNLCKQGVDRLFLGIANETAGVDDDSVAVVLPTVEIDMVSHLSEVAGDVFRVDGVFAAPEGDDVDFQLW